MEILETKMETQKNPKKRRYNKNTTEKTPKNRFFKYKKFII